ncbi:hypothetical protein F2A31_07985 [Acinetobacter suaedae]|uniref:Lipoprotein n=1 Tax=Acinetobacter suaedae TaxID=2609668 RepID=A0A5P1UWU5_9GAMM|nr:hypothetical protein [Acinetobacter sp. C16S1]QER39656.1 hypothetical protein F2A31_07985 [Acinetobacter sp. C16S1]
MYKAFNYYLASLCLLTVSLSGCGNNSDDQLTLAPPPAETSDCFWQGPYVRENPETNFAFPDTGSAYWSAQYTLPEGAVLRLKGDFPYARYMSINSYRLDTTPADAISDDKIIPNQNSINPFINGNPRNNSNRSYTLNVAAGEAPESKPANTIYDYATGQTTLVYRVYVPNKGKDLLGGVTLPKVELTTRQGEVLNGQAACDALKAVNKTATGVYIDPNTYAAARKNNPAKEIPVWRTSYNMAADIQCVFYGVCDTNPKRNVAYYANLDNQYISTFLDRSIKPIVVIRGKIPRVPKTLNGEDHFDSRNAQLRYWSMCQNEFYSQKVSDCLFDENITINPDGKYTIVTSIASDRPNNATKECGVDFLKWSENGDGFSMVSGREDHKTDARVNVRNMLPVNNFQSAIQNTKTPGDEAEVLGEYLPQAKYFTKEEFEALGCNPYQKLNF